MISGLIFLNDGYDRRLHASHLDRAKLAAADIGRGHISDGFVINLTTSTAPITAGSYFWPWTRLAPRRSRSPSS